MTDRKQKLGLALISKESRPKLEPLFLLEDTALISHARRRAISADFPAFAQPQSVNLYQTESPCHLGIDPVSTVSTLPQ